MLRTMWPHGILRSTAAAMAGLVAGGAVPLPAGPSAAQAGAANKAKVYVFPYQQVFEGVPRAMPGPSSHSFRFPEPRTVNSILYLDQHPQLH